MGVVIAGRNLTAAARELRDSLAGALSECQRAKRTSGPGRKKKRKVPTGRASDGNLTALQHIIGGPWTSGSGHPDDHIS